MPYLCFAFICLCWGTSFILMDRAGHAFGPASIGAGRMLCGAITLGLYCTITRRWAPISRSDWARIALVALLANAWPYIVQPLVMQRAGEHGFFGMLVTLVPIATIAAAGVMLRQWPEPRQWLGVVGGLACAVLLVWDGSQRGMRPGLLALAVSTPISYAFGNTFLKWKLDHLPTAPLATLFLAVGAAIALPFALPPLSETIDLAGPSVAADWPLAAASLAALGVGSTGVAILAFVHLIQTQGPLFAGMVTYVVPVVALMWGQVDGERLTAVQVVAIAGMLAMVALVQWGAARPPEVTSEPPV